MPSNSSLPHSRHHYFFPLENSCCHLLLLENSIELYFTECVMELVRLNSDISVITAIL